jgi:hypothetical protein
MQCNRRLQITERLDNWHPRCVESNFDSPMTINDMDRIDKHSNVVDWTMCPTNKQRTFPVLVSYVSLVCAMSPMCSIINRCYNATKKKLALSDFMFYEYVSTKYSNVAYTHLYMNMSAIVRQYSLSMMNFNVDASEPVETCHVFPALTFVFPIEQHCN